MKPHTQTEHELMLLARAVRFPASREHLIRYALNRGYSQPVLRFLLEYPKYWIFDSQREFNEQVLELELFATELGDMPKEHLRSPQD